MQNDKKKVLNIKNAILRNKTKICQKIPPNQKQNSRSMLSKESTEKLRAH